jgi:catechol 2,3-dioxygenase-like lactoylglutathione lyase family enzyme
MMSDLGLTHVAFVVKNLEASIAFYGKYANMAVIHRRAGDDGAEIAWITDGTRPVVIVLLQLPGAADTPLGPMGHLGVAVASHETVDRLAAEARREGRLRKGPADYGPPVGYWAYIADPDGNILEISYGQDVAFTVESARALNGDP